MVHKANGEERQISRSGKFNKSAPSKSCESIYKRKTCHIFSFLPPPTPLGSLSDALVTGCGWKQQDEMYQVSLRETGSSCCYWKQVESLYNVVSWKFMFSRFFDKDKTPPMSSFSLEKASSSWFWQFSAFALEQFRLVGFLLDVRCRPVGTCVAKVMSWLLITPTSLLWIKSIRGRLVWLLFGPENGGIWRKRYGADGMWWRGCFPADGERKVSESCEVEQMVVGIQSSTYSCLRSMLDP